MKKSRLNIPTLIILSASITTTITPAWADGLKVNSNISIAETNKVSEEQISEMNERIDVNEYNIESLVNKDEVSEEQINKMNRRVDVNEFRIDNIENREVVGEFEGNLQYWDGVNWTMIAPPDPDTLNTKVLKHGINGFEWVADAEMNGGTKLECRLWNRHVFEEAFMAAVRFGDNSVMSKNGVKDDEFIKLNHTEPDGIDTEIIFARDGGDTLRYAIEVYNSRSEDRYNMIRYVTTRGRPDGEYGNGFHTYDKYEVVSQDEFDNCLAVLKLAM
jgi:hypothetical protein